MKVNHRLFIWFFPILIIGCTKLNQAQNIGTIVVDSNQIKLQERPLTDTLWRNGRVASITSLQKIETTTPEPIGGMDSLVSFISNNLHYPLEALEKKVEGNVIVVLTIHPDSTLSIFDVFDLGYGTREEAERVILASGKWKPAINKETGEHISATILVPITFKIK